MSDEEEAAAAAAAAAGASGSSAGGGSMAADELRRVEQVEQELEKLGNESAMYESARDAVKHNMHNMLWSLQCGSRDERVRTALEIRKLTKTSPKCRAYLAAAGVIVPLVAMLRPGNDAETRESAVLALLNLSVGNERNKVKIVNAGAVESLVELLRSGHGRLRESAIATLLTLSAATPNKPVIGASGAPALLVDMLDDDKQQGQQAKVDALMALYNLSTDADSLSRILVCKPVGPLVALLRDSKKSSKVADRCTALLLAVAGFDKGIDAIGKEEGGIMALVEVLEDGSLSSRERAVGILLAMCQSSRERYREAILGEGVIPGLLELTVQGTHTGQQKACALLQMLREQPAPQERAAADAAMLESIVFDIANHVDSSNAASPTSTAAAAAAQQQPVSARKLLTEMVPHISMEHRISPAAPTPPRQQIAA